MGKITFITTLSSGNNPHSWDLPQNYVMALKPGAGKKFIAYYKGEDTIFTEEMYLKNKDIKPSKIPSFEYSELSKRTELTVDDGDTNLILYLKTHPWFNKKYTITSKELEAENKISSYEKVENALELVRRAEPEEVRATALAVLGFGYFSKTQSECVADLKERAFKDPKSIIDIMTASNYQDRFIASLAYCNNIIENNPTNTAIVWSDNKGVIVHVAVGEKSIDKLTEFLSTNSAEAQVVLQEFGARVDKFNKQVKLENFDISSAKKELSAKDKEIEDLKAQLAAKSDDAPGSADKYADITLEEAAALYKEQKGTDVPTAKASNKTWIVKQLS